jgi:hypothetical protein
MDGYHLQTRAENKTGRGMKQRFIFLLWDPVLEKSLIRLLALVESIEFEVWDVRRILNAYTQIDTAYMANAGIQFRRLDTPRQLKDAIGNRKDLLFGTRITLFYGGNQVLKTIHAAGNALMAFRVHPVFGDIPYLDQRPFIAEWKADRTKNVAKHLLKFFRQVDIRNASTYAHYLQQVNTISAFVHVGSYSLQQQVFQATADTQYFSIKNPDIAWFELQNQQQHRLVENPYILFLDNDYALHADFAYKASAVEIENYYTQLHALFDRLETQLRLPVIVALHPKAEMEKVMPYWRGRTVIQHQTPLLIRDAALNLCHHTTSLNWAAYFGKPVSVILNDLVDIREETEYVRAFAQEIGAGILDCNRPEDIDATRLLQLPAAMDTFREKYICTKEAISLEQIFESWLAKKP